MVAFIPDASEERYFAHSARESDGEWHRLKDHLEATGQMAANAMVALAKDIGVSLDVDFEWRDKEQAANPGRRARIQIPARWQEA